MSEHNKESGPAGSRSTSMSSSDSDSRVSRTRYRLRSFAGSLRMRLRSLSNPGMAQVDRVFSRRHMNDRSVYHSDASNDDASTLKGEGRPDRIQEVRNGVANERDLDSEKGDAQQPELEKPRDCKVESVAPWSEIGMLAVLFFQVR